tara:strand:- start:69 stop:809 length:741 start_codon:yes stop_codon:yes gene_type:complete
MRLTIPINYCPVTIEVDPVDLFFKYSAWQRPYRKNGFQPNDIIESEFEALTASWTHTFKKLADNGVFKKSPNVMIDVGTGLGLLPILLSKYFAFANTEFILIDRPRIDNVTVYQSYDNAHGFYTGFELFERMIEVNNIDRKRFTILDPDSSWPGKAELVVSTLSWCWHYPRLVYWSRLINSLTPGGIVSVDMSNWTNEDSRKEFSSYFQCDPAVIPISSYPHQFPNAWTIDSDGNRGYSCAWTNNL